MRSSHPEIFPTIGANFAPSPYVERIAFAMSTAEMTFTDTIKTLGDSIVKLTVLEAKSLGDYLENVHGIKAAAVAAGPAMPAAPTEAAESRPRRPSSTWSWRTSAPRRST